MSTSFMTFELLGSDGGARLGRLVFPRGVVDTPAFMPVGTYGTVKAILPRDLEATGAQIVLGNTFHLMLRPGTAAHRFRWFPGLQPGRDAQDYRGRGAIPFAGRRQ